LPVHAVVGAVEVITSHDNKPIPGAKITIMLGDETVKEEETDRGGVALISLEEGDYTLLIETAEGTVKETVTVEGGQLVSVTGDVGVGKIHKNSQPLDRYRPLNAENPKKGYEVSLADLGGLLSYKFTTPEGSIYLGFPYYAAVGETISFSAILLPVGADAKKLEKNRKELSEYSFMIDDQKYSLKESTLWNLKAMSHSTVRLVSGRRNKSLISTKVDFRLGPLKEAALTESGNDSAFFANAGWPVCIPGSFDGIASNTEVYYGDSRMNIVAETPSSLLFNPPSTLPGLHAVRITEGGNTFQRSVRTISIQLSVDQNELWKGESTGLHLKVLGLEGFEKTAFVKLINLTTATIHLSGGNYRFFSVPPGDFGEEGIASYDLSIRGTKRGHFQINAFLTDR
jgi:hypothetical protein